MYSFILKNNLFIVFQIGTVKDAVWFDSNVFGVLTDNGLFIYDSTTSLNISKCKIFFDESFDAQKVVFDNDSKTVFILDAKGRVKKSKIEEAVLHSYSMETVFEGCLTILKGIDII